MPAGYKRETLERKGSLRVPSSQIVLRGSVELFIGVWRDDDGNEGPFDITLRMPWGSFYKVAHYMTRARAERSCARMLAQLRSGEAKIVIGNRFRIILQKKHKT